MLDSSLMDTILKATAASRTTRCDLIQNLWDGYGQILRIGLDGSPYPSVIVKLVRWPDKKRDRNVSHQRKVRSYQVELEWYRTWNSRCSKSSRVPHCLAVDTINGQMILVLEDLDCSGFTVRNNRASISDAKLCLEWLANFHAQFMGEQPNGLWKVGTYWHLATRPDELKRLNDTRLRDAAPLIDKKLNAAKYKTIVHGDAKLANFCFSRDGKKIAAVDFQYVGGGCGMKDVTYLIDSCFSESEAEQQEKPLLDYYFRTLSKALSTSTFAGDPDALETEWRSLYHIAKTDFHRFIKGWTTDNWSVASYSERIARQVIAHELT